MRNFPFNQPEKTRDCGYRCMYYAISPNCTYEKWLNQFRFFNPVEAGINFSDICNVLKHYNIDFKFTQLSGDGLYIVYSGIWLHPEGKKHGHYFVYHNGVVMCSTHSEPYRMSFDETIRRLEAKSVDLAFRCMKVMV